MPEIEKEAEFIALNFNYRFFDQDATCSVIEKPGGYRRVE